MITPRILVVDDEKQIHASLRLHLSRNYELASCLNAREALEKLRHEEFDLCFVDIHMPKMDGLSFINAARKIDPVLGYVVLSAFDSDENLRRTIPLQVYDFVPKPLPERSRFEARLPGWIDETRKRRRNHELAKNADGIASNLDAARLELEIELMAAETAREALSQTATLLTTIQAHIISASSVAASRLHADLVPANLLRNLAEARRATDAAASTVDGFFNSAFGNRETSPAIVDEGARNAISIALRMCANSCACKTIDFAGLDVRLTIRDLSAMQYLLMLVPPLIAALVLAESTTTVRVSIEKCARLDAGMYDPRWNSLNWLNRRTVRASHAGVLIAITSNARPLAREQTDAWLRGESQPLSALAQRGLVSGMNKCHGHFGYSFTPEHSTSQFVMTLPV